MRSRLNIRNQKNYHKVLSLDEDPITGAESTEWPWPSCLSATGTTPTSDGPEKAATLRKTFAPPEGRSPFKVFNSEGNEMMNTEDSIVVSRYGTSADGRLQRR